MFTSFRDLCYIYMPGKEAAFRDRSRSSVAIKSTSMVFGEIVNHTTSALAVMKKDVAPVWLAGWLAFPM